MGDPAVCLSFDGHQLWVAGYTGGWNAFWVCHSSPMIGKHMEAPTESSDQLATHPLTPLQGSQSLSQSTGVVCDHCHSNYRLAIVKKICQVSQHRVFRWILGVFTWQRFKPTTLPKVQGFIPPLLLEQRFVIPDLLTLSRFYGNLIKQMQSLTIFDEKTSTD